MLERWGLERFVYNIEPIGDDGFFFYPPLQWHINQTGGFFMRKVYVNRTACMRAKAYFVPVANRYTPCPYGHDESIVEGYGDY